ncbi:sterol desaturase family protein [Roseimicrobium sp. ORNL1]|uniref:sterol desaturase family protein n=1 Tax=Roseimicrobium sp. ORNL1 TaxID=2711231 RepID=UPI0013E112E8|nr:sterol desaturase family protein [Roseimicrobium sp. ORNL1]QIF00110.1 sterol desaturase family protein [Roseimicrobium sp. ORNL1]
MSFVSRVTDYLLWPALFIGALIPTGYGMARGHGPLAFNVTYLTLATVLFVLEKVRPHEDAWLESDGQAVPDLAHTLFTKIAVQVAVVSLTNLGISEGMGDRGSSGIWPSHWPMFLQVALGLVVAEFGLYWAHRLAHEWMPLWRFHAVHHSSKKLWFFNTGRFHFVDTIKSMVFATPFIALTGAPGAVFIWGSAITAYIGILTHCNVRMRFGWLNYIFNTPGLHRWHHSMDLREGNKNYGENLVLWDLLFGTYFDDATRRPPQKIGIKEAMPKGFFGQLAAPFVWKRYQARMKAERLAEEAAVQETPLQTVERA